MEIKPADDLQEKQLSGTTLFYSLKLDSYYYKLQLNPFNYRQITSNLSIHYEGNIELIQDISYFLPISPFFFVVSYLKTILQFQDLRDALINAPTQIKSLDFSKCQFLEHLNDLSRFSENKYIEYCQTKYQLLIKLDAEELAPIFFKHKLNEIVPKKAVQNYSNNVQKTSAKRSQKQTVKVGAIDGFLKKK